MLNAWRMSHRVTGSSAACFGQLPVVLLLVVPNLAIAVGQNAFHIFAADKGSADTSAVSGHTLYTPVFSKTVPPYAVIDELYLRVRYKLGESADTAPLVGIRHETPGSTVNFSPTQL